MNCTLCQNNDIQQVQGPDHRSYFLCRNCKLIFTDDLDKLSETDEKNRYLLHTNSIHDSEYVNFLNQAILPALDYIEKPATGLDFGCGPYPSLSELLKKRGFACDNYDPFFFPIQLNKKYDFIFATECFEHFFFPAKEIQTLKNILIDNGVLVVMSERWNSIQQFSTWYYARDPAHVTFFNMETFKFIAKKYNFTIVFSDDKRVVILKNKLILQ